MHDFSVEGVHQMFGGSDFSRVERNFTKSPKIWCNFSKIDIKINKNLQTFCENSRKMQIFRKFFKDFLTGNNFLIIGKIRN